MVSGPITAFYTVLFVAFGVAIVLVLLLIWRLRVNGYRRASAIILALLVAFAVVPPLHSQWAWWRLSQMVTSQAIVPDPIDFEGATVVFVGSHCETDCDKSVFNYALAHGGLAGVYQALLYPARDFDADGDNLFGALAEHGDFARFDLIDGLSDDGLPFEVDFDASFDAAAMDYTVVLISARHITGFEDSFGLTPEVGGALGRSYVLFEGWPAKGDQPIARFLSATGQVRPVLVWPIYSEYVAKPSFAAHRDTLRSWFCAAPTWAELMPPPDLC